MARFDVYRLGGRGAPLVVDVQANLLSSLATRVVVPLAPKATALRESLPRLKPVFRVGSASYVFSPTEIAVLPAGILRDPIANLETDYRSEIVTALDFLFQGF